MHSNEKRRRRRGRNMDATTEQTTVERTITIAAPPEAVWEYFVDPEKLERWMGIGAELEPTPGGVYRCEVLTGHIARGEFVEVDRPRHSCTRGAGNEAAT
jgi:uncharacterized protein YndB with AHSA1/START domain